MTRDNEKQEQGPTRRFAIITCTLLSCLMVLFAAFPPASHAIPIFGNATTGATEGLASFTGTFNYDDVASELVVVLTNTTSSATGGFLTAFAFNNPSNLITAVSLSSTLFTFNTLLGGGTTFQDGISASPFGKFDIGASTNSSWLGGGGPGGGIGAGSSATFTFDLSCNINPCGNNLSESAFLSALSSSPQGGGAQFFVARFRGLSDDQSDKVPGAPIPEPGTLLLIGSGLVGIGISVRSRRQEP